MENNITNNQELMDAFSQFTNTGGGSGTGGNSLSVSLGTGYVDTGPQYFSTGAGSLAASGVTSLANISSYNCIIGGCNTTYFPYYDYSVTTDDPNKMVIENVENGFVLKFKGKVFVATKEENLFKLISKLNEKEGK